MSFLASEGCFWSKFLCGMYGFIAKSFIARLNILRLLIRWEDKKSAHRWHFQYHLSSIYPPPLVTYLKNAPLLVCSLQMSIVIFSIINMFWQDFFLLAWKTSKINRFSTLRDIMVLIHSVGQTNKIDLQRN